MFARALNLLWLVNYTNDRKRFLSINDCEHCDSSCRFLVGARRLYDPIDRSVAATNENTCIQSGACDRPGVGLGKVPRRRDGPMLKNHICST